VAAGRFWSKVKKTETCWLWVAGREGHGGYGLFWLNGRNEVAHRVSYTWCNGPIPAGVEIDHICRVRQCVNPEHLRPVSRKQNNENRSRANAKSQSGVRGVNRHASGRWRVRVRHNGVEYSGGTYAALADAECAAIALRNRLFSHNNADR
jgi:hypothetical protein